MNTNYWTEGDDCHYSQLILLVAKDIIGAGVPLFGNISTLCVLSLNWCWIFLSLFSSRRLPSRNDSSRPYAPRPSPQRLRTSISRSRFRLWKFRCHVSTVVKSLCRELLWAAASDPNWNWNIGPAIQAVSASCNQRQVWSGRRHFFFRHYVWILINIRSSLPYLRISFIDLLVRLRIFNTAYLPYSSIDHGHAGIKSLLVRFPSWVNTGASEKLHGIITADSYALVITCTRTAFYKPDRIGVLGYWWLGFGPVCLQHCCCRNPSLLGAVG